MDKQQATAKTWTTELGLWTVELKQLKWYENVKRMSDNILSHQLLN